MGEANEGERCKMENLSIQTNRYPIDLLQSFMSSSNRNVSMYESAVEDSEKIELNLGLSLGGRFGVDKNKSQLIRSSSIAGSMAVVGDDVFSAPMPVSYAALIRTSSLPTETEEDWRKRKELQTLRRMEAKRRRSEKQKNIKLDRDSGGGGGVERNFEDERREIESNSPTLQQQKQYGGANRFGSAAVPPPIGVPAAARQAVVCGGGIDIMVKGKGGFMGGGGGSWQGFVQPSSQGSAESQGGSSSGMSDLESKPLQGSRNCEARSPSSIHSLQERSNQEAVVSFGTKMNEIASKIPGDMDLDNPSKKPKAAEKREKEIATTSVENMPCVFTTGNGPNGRRIDGILYKYGKGEEVRIMCVCHGSFLSPAEFVKHAGGGDVAHPLRHIVVNTSSTASSL